MDAGEIGRDVFRAAARAADPAIGALVGAAYDAAAQPDGWGTFLGALIGTGAARSAALLDQDLHDGRILPLGVAGPDGGLETPAAAAGWLDAGDPMRLRDLPVGTVIDPRECERPPAPATRWPVPAPPARWPILAIAGREVGGLTVWAIEPVAGAHESCLHLVRVLAPHLIRALQWRRRLDELDWRATLADDVLERLRFGAMQVDPAGRIERISPSAHRLLAERGVLAGDGAPALALRGALRQRWLALVRSACLGGLRWAADEETGLLSLPPAEDRPALDLLVAPLPPSRGFATPSRAAALVFVARRDDPVPDLSPAVLASLYALTHAESQVLAALIAGDSVSEVAQRRGVSLDTVRTQVRGLLAKCGQRRQVDLVRTVTASMIGRLARNPFRG